MDLRRNRALPYNRDMDKPAAVVELPEFQKAAADLWTDAERHDLIDWAARHPQAGAVIRGSGGLRKLRWAAAAAAGARAAAPGSSIWRWTGPGGCT